MVDDDCYSGPASDLVDDIYEITESGAFTDERIPRLCERALRLDPGCFPAHVAMGCYEMGKGNHDTMFGHFLRALELADDLHNAYTWDTVIMTLDDALKDYRRLAQYLYKFYEKEPRLFVARYLARILGGKLKRKSEAVAILSDYSQKHPSEKKILKLVKKAEKGKWYWI